MIPVDAFVLTPEWSVLALLGCLLLVGLKHPELAVGIYLAMVGWTRNVFVGSISQTWVLMATTIAATGMYLLRSPKVSRLPRHDRWIMPWVMVWWGWMLILIFSSRDLYEPGQILTLLRTLLLYVIFPLPILLIVSKDTTRLRNFALAYVLTALVGGGTSISALGIPLRYVYQDPLLRGFAVINLGIKNYHWIGHMFGVSIILLAGLFTESTKPYARVLAMAGIAMSTYFLILTGSRQSLIATLFATTGFLLWAQWRRKLPKISVFLLLASAILIGYIMIQSAPTLILREALGESAMPDVITGFGENRSALRAQAWADFLRSPIWGTALTKHSSAHNFFLATLSDQGVVGMIFLVGVLVFLFRQIAGFWYETTNRTLDIWRANLVAVVLFALIHSQASGTPLSVWHFWWPMVFLWQMKDSIRSPIAQNDRLRSPQHSHMEPVSKTP